MGHMSYIELMQYIGDIRDVWDIQAKNVRMRATHRFFAGARGGESVISLLIM
jgi:hypothetical protein